MRIKRETLSTRQDGLKNKGPIPIRPGIRSRPSRKRDTPAHGSELEPRFRFVSAQARDAVFTVDPEGGVVIDANDAFRAMVGVAAEAIPGLALETFTTAFPGVVDGEIKAVASVGGRFTFECDWRDARGHLMRVRCSTQNVQTPTGDRRVIVVAHDLLDALRQEAIHDLVARHAAPADALFMWVDETGEIEAVHEGAALKLGYAADALVGKPLKTVDVTFSDMTWEALANSASRIGHAKLETQFQTATGEQLLVEVDLFRVAIGSRRALCLSAHEKQAHGHIADANDRYSLAALGANDGLWDWNVVTGEVAYSRRWRDILGLGDRVVQPNIHAWLDRIHADDRVQVDADLHAHLEGKTAHFESEHRVRHAAGSYRWVLVRGVAERDDHGGAIRMAGSQTDITQRKNAEARLRFEAFHDPLTGLANRSLLIKQLHDALDKARATPDGLFAVIFLDVDRFKVINDSLGHNMGDMLLRAIAARLKRCVRTVDTVARLGGDEFMLLLTNVAGIEDALRVADRVQEEIGIPFNLRGYEVFSSVSLGVALSNPDYREAEELLRDADIAMYRAKTGGANKRAIFDASMRQAAVQRLTVETDLRKAVERDEFSMHYQPLIDLGTGRIKGFEALIRWNHAKRGAVGPAQFIPLAEETGIIVPIGRWALQRACEEARRWEVAGHSIDDAPSVSVNVSGRQLVLPFLVDQVDEILTSTGLPPHRLNLEITESVLMENAAAAQKTLLALRGLGVRLHIDDFGTGYSSLAYLHRFPIDQLKIDRSFLMEQPDDEDPWAIVSTIRSLAAALGMTVTAEGVEEIAQLERLKRLGIEYAQGYFFSRPVPADRVQDLLQKTYPTG